MAKTKVSSKKSVSFYKQHSRLGVLSGILLLVALIIAGYLVVQQVRVNHQRQQFMQAKADLHSLYLDIVGQVGPPAEHKEVQSCSRTSAKFNEGALFCSTNQNLLYYVENKTEAQVKTSAIEKAIDQSEIVSRVKVDTDTRFFPGQILSTSFSDRSFISCSTDYRFTLETTGPITGYLYSAKSAVIANIDCQALALEKYF